jgi:hypothetical protein
VRAGAAALRRRAGWTRRARRGRWAPGVSVRGAGVAPPVGGVARREVWIGDGARSGRERGRKRPRPKARGRPDGVAGCGVFIT